MKKIILDIDETTLSIANAFDNFMTAKRCEGRRDTTLRSYRTSFKDFQRFCDDNGILNISEINKDLITRYKEHLLDMDVSIETRNTYLRAVKAVAYYLMNEEDLPQFKIKLFPAPSKERVSTFSDDELKRLLNCRYKNSKSFCDVRDYYMMLTLLLTGIRRSTISNMKIEDVDFDTERICLRHIKRDNEFKIKQIPLNPDLNNLLRKYLKLTKLREQNIEYLFPNVEGKRMHPDTISKCIYKLCEAAGIQPRSCHEFRRTFATKCYNQLDDAEKTRKLMLISDARVLKHYINEDLGTLQECAQQLNFVTQIQTPRILQGKIGKKIQR